MYLFITYLLFGWLTSLQYTLTVTQNYFKSNKKLWGSCRSWSPM